MATTPSSSDRGRRLSRTGGGGRRRGRGNAKPPVDLHLLAAAYVLDALDERQREAFEAHLSDCEPCRTALDISPGPLAALTVAGTPLVAPPPSLAATLRDVVIEALPQTSQVEFAWRPSPTFDDAGETGPDASPVDDHSFAPTPDDAPGSTGATAPTAAPPVQPMPPSWDAWAHRGPAAVVATPESDDGRSGAARPDAQDRGPAARPAPSPGGTGAWSASGGVGQTSRMQLVAVVATTLLAIVLLAWGYRERSAIGRVEAELDAQRTAVADIRANANASSFTMVPTERGPAAASGTAFFALPAMRGALVLAGMPTLPEGQAYQLWFVTADGAVAPGPAARTDAAGNLVVAFDATGLEVERLYVTLAPLTGTTQADLDRFPVLLLGILGGATR